MAVLGRKGALPTGLGELSNAVLPRIAGGMIAIGSGYGTLSEVSHAVKLGRPVVSIGSWEVRPPGADGLDPAIHVAETPRAAVDWLLERLAAGAGTPGTSAGGGDRLH